MSEYLLMLQLFRFFNACLKFSRNRSIDRLKFSRNLSIDRFVKQICNGVIVYFLDVTRLKAITLKCIQVILTTIWQNDCIWIDLPSRQFTNALMCAVVQRLRWQVVWEKDDKVNIIYYCCLVTAVPSFISIRTITRGWIWSKNSVV